MPQFKTPASVVAEAQETPEPVIVAVSLESVREHEFHLAEYEDDEQPDWMEDESGEPLALDEAYQRFHGRSDW